MITNYKQYIKFFEEYEEEDEEMDEMDLIKQENEEDEYPIEILEIDDYHKYERCGGVLYQLDGDYREVSVNSIAETEENTFYQEQIDKYVRYIENGGIIETLPVQVNIKYNFEEFLEEYDNLDDVYDDFIRFLKDEYDEEIKSVVIDVLDDYIDKLEDFDRLNYRSSSINYMFPSDITEEEEEIKDILKPVYVFLKEECEEFTLTDMNHRFRALQEIGVKNILVEEIN